MAINMKEFKQSRKEFSNSKMTGAYYWSPKLNMEYYWCSRYEREYFQGGWNHLPDEDTLKSLILVGFEETVSYYSSRCYYKHEYNYYANSSYKDAVKLPEEGRGAFGSYVKKTGLSGWAKELGMDTAFECCDECDSSD